MFIQRERGARSTPPHALSCSRPLVWGRILFSGEVTDPEMHLTPSLYGIRLLRRHDQGWSGHLGLTDFNVANRSAASFVNS